MESAYLLLGVQGTFNAMPSPTGLLLSRLSARWPPYPPRHQGISATIAAAARGWLSRHSANRQCLGATGGTAGLGLIPAVPGPNSLSRERTFATIGTLRTEKVWTAQIAELEAKLTQLEMKFAAQEKSTNSVSA